MKVLVADDDAMIRETLVRLLETHGYETDACESGDEALERLERGQLDLMILDWNLLDLDGLCVCRRLRDRGDTIPILMVTARADIPEKIAALQAGADGYMVKPFDPGELLARIRALLRLCRRGASLARRSLFFVRPRWFVGRELFHDTAQHRP